MYNPYLINGTVKTAFGVPIANPKHSDEPTNLGDSFITSVTTAIRLSMTPSTGVSVFDTDFQSLYTYTGSTWVKE